MILFISMNKPGKALNLFIRTMEDPNKNILSLSERIHHARMLTPKTTPIYLPIERQSLQEESVIITIEELKRIFQHLDPSIAPPLSAASNYVLKDYANDDSVLNMFRLFY